LPDPANQGLGVADAGVWGGMGGCGDMHPFPRVVVIDHHRPGDPGYGRPPEEFLAASSIGQVITELARLGRLPPEPRRYGGISSSIMDDGWDRGLPSWVP